MASGIDGSGKSTAAPALAAALGERRLHAAVVTVDPRHTPPAAMTMPVELRTDVVVEPTLGLLSLRRALQQYLEPAFEVWTP